LLRPSLASPSSLPGILRDVDSLYLGIVPKRVFAVDAAAGAAGDSVSCVGQAVGDRVVAVHLARAIAELLGQGDAAFHVLRPDARAQTVGRTVGQPQGLLWG